ncbi:MAG: hydantoinase/oxoprolinase family protein [Alphaproteobacteria bacterium]|nr:hydantoinase/oxoprolinase family protein [Alphaproteobacteria bacterium]
MWFIGVDVGGTFTDFHAMNISDGRVCLHKTPSTPSDPSESIINGLGTLLEDNEIDVKDVIRLAHGTTVATNALIQRRGGKVAVVTTEGFKDLLEIGRQIRPKMYDLKADNPLPLSDRHMRFEITERVGSKGQIIKPLSDDSIKNIIKIVNESKADACAVCLLFSFLMPEHEKKIADELRKSIPGLHVSLSAEVQPEFREYERFSTTLLNAYLQPMIGRYMQSLGEKFTRKAPNARLGINQSSGGLMSVERAGAMPIRTALSGPAAGTVGAIYQAKLGKKPNIITLDMGGTSADVALIQNYESGIGYNRMVADFPVRLPMIDIHTVGAGGGSVAWFDKDNLMKVGPLSAGAEPGPACYSRGGTEATVSDANLILGRLPDSLIGGAMVLDIQKAKTAILPIAKRLGFSIERTAHGILGIVVSNMVRAIRVVSVERGHDPRDFSLMAFGGAGALHATHVARELDIKEIIVPPSPGILCAQGLVVSELKEDFVVTRRMPYDHDTFQNVQGDLKDLIDRAEKWFGEEDISTEDRVIRISFDMRYVRQNFELTIAWVENIGPLVLESLPSLEVLLNRFYEQHERTYGHYTEKDPIEIVNIRLMALGRSSPKIDLLEEEPMVNLPDPVSMRSVWFEADKSTKTPIYSRNDLLFGHVLLGPAIIEQLDAVTVICPGDEVKVDGSRNLIIKVQA